NVQAAGSEAVRVQEELCAVFGGAKVPILVLLEGDGPASQGGSPGAEAGRRREAEAEALRAAARLEAPLQDLLGRGLVASWTSPAQLVPPREEERRAIAVLSRKDPAVLEEALRSELDAAGFESDRIEAAARTLRTTLSLREPLGAG